MVPAQDGATTSGDTLLHLPLQTHSLNQGSTRLRQRQGSPARKLAMTRKQKERRDFKESENPEEAQRRHKERELKPLYKELLYTITHRLGKPATKTKYSEHQLYEFIQQAFSMTDDEHKSLADKVRNAVAPVYCLMVTIKEAKGILGKDINGFSDPYCILTILQKEKESRDPDALMKPKKAVVKSAAPERNIFQTDVKKQTLNPKWDETFKLEFEDIIGDNLHVEMWDKDEELSLAQKLEDIRTNIHGLKRMIKDAKKEKGQDDFLGSVVLKLQDLHCTEDRWYKLEPRTETYPDRGECRMQFKFIHKERDETLSAGRSPYVNYCGILQQFVQAHISKHQGSGTWKGELSGEGTTLLEFYATQNDLSPFLQDLAKWVAYSKLYQSLEVDSTVLFQQLTSIEYHWDQQKLPYQQKKELGDSLHDFLQYGLCLVSKYRDIFPPKQDTTARLHTLLRVLMQICKTRAFQNLNPAQFDLCEEVTDSVQVGTQEWFNIKKGLHQPMTKDMPETVRALSSLISEVKEDIQVSKDVWNKVFYNTVKLDVFTVVYTKLDSLLAVEIQQTLAQMCDQMEQSLANTLFPVYLSLQAVHKDKNFLKEWDKPLQLTNFHELFRDALPYWLNTAFSTTMERVEKAVQVDQLQPLQGGSAPIKYSSSAVDLAACLQPIAFLWEQLAWPDPEEGFMLMVKITEDMCKISSTYSQMLKQRVKRLSEDSDQGRAINMLCVVVNDLEHLRTVLSHLPHQLKWAGLRERTRHVINDTQFQNTLHSQLQHTQVVLSREIRSAVDTLARKLHTDIETYVRNMASRHRHPSKSTEDAVIPLMGYLEKELKYMNENLVQENFNSLLIPLWTNSVKILHQVSAQEGGTVIYFQRLQYTLQCLEQCFHAEGNGLPLENLHTEEYKVLQDNLTSNALGSRQLIEKFLERKIMEQKVQSSKNYGAVTLIASFRRSDSRLIVEVLNAVNLIPMDSNGFSDPFVQLSLEPRHLFHEVETRSTKIKTRELNPLFDEAFEFLVSVEQCQAAGAVLVVTVFDYDTLRSDDFEGEAFLSLKGVPGVGGDVTDPLPAQIRLPLMHPKPNSDNYLKMLESRKDDREAQAFVKLRKQREKKSLEV
ncbi:protein unc-13 homolog D [Denticeps clupeoides]|uniref:protein unc-13 homolog D n=1 Tax=Denticeps clupeoides TaxID=299321 RepID=UPI0010A44C7D|nr:protein unc-13 homolog D [Denticeps clupeoides]XP_028821117.1 protein unc-13 homolog D [Denticeps clupeoides]XP_028821118.1 protein unc-13 homolog D [Denticeps clupeoides]